jgi:hypothetical protein
MKSPEQTVRDFIRAYSAWNDRANERCEEARDRGEPQQAALVAAETDYRTLLERFCAPSVVPQGIAFGSESTHHPDRENLKSADVSASEAKIRTRNVGTSGFETDYEYRLVQADGEWRIASLLYIDEEGTYECL